MFTADRPNSIVNKLIATNISSIRLRSVSNDLIAINLIARMRVTYGIFLMRRDMNIANLMKVTFKFNFCRTYLTASLSFFISSIIYRE